MQRLHHDVGTEDILNIPQRSFWLHGFLMFFVVILRSSCFLWFSLDLLLSSSSPLRSWHVLAPRKHPVDRSDRRPTCHPHSGFAVVEALPKAAFDRSGKAKRKKGRRQWFSLRLGTFYFLLVVVSCGKGVVFSFFAGQNMFSLHLGIHLLKVHTERPRKKRSCFCPCIIKHIYDGWGREYKEP